MKHCKKCILPETYPGITFNDEGICNFCLEHKPEVQVLGKEKLIEVLKSKERYGCHDCVVPLSGGKDSTFILYFVVRELGLRPLVVSYNSGYQSKIAEENVRNACDILDVDLVEIRSPGDIQTKLLRTSYLLSQKKGENWGACVNCEAILRVVSKNIAKKNNIPFVIWGSSTVEAMDKKIYQERNLGKKQHPAKRNLFIDLSRKIIKGFKNPYTAYLQIEYVILRIIQRIALHFPFRDALRPFSIPPLSVETPQFIIFFDYIHWDSMNNVTLLEHELGWRHPQNSDSRFDCTLHCVGNINKLKDFGISQDGLSFCNFIREGRMNREEALIRESKVLETIEEEYNALLERIN